VKKTVKAIVLPLATEGSYQDEIFQEVLKMLLDAPTTTGLERELAYMARRARVMDVEIDA